LQGSTSGIELFLLRKIRLVISADCAAKKAVVVALVFVVESNALACEQVPSPNSIASTGEQLLYEQPWLLVCLPSQTSLLLI
jgi:hypothetical protein